MTMNAGWIMLHRTLLDNALARRPAYCHLWVHLLLRACHKEISFIWNERCLRLGPGQLLTGRKQLSQQTGIPEGTVEKILRYLETEQQVEQQSTAKFRIITIKNWALYQTPPAGEQQRDNSVTAEQQQRDTYDKKKNEKNEEKRIHADAWRLGEVLLGAILERKPDFRKPQLDRWAKDIDRMLSLDGRTPERAEAVIRWCRRDPFWSNNILSPAALRKHFDRLELEMDRCLPRQKESTREMVERMEREGTL
jgi:hypothetical protein